MRARTWKDSFRQSSTRSSPTTDRAGGSLRFEVALAFAGVAAWVIALVALVAGRALAGLAGLGLYPLYATAGILGWGFGNLYVARRRRFGGPLRRRLLPLYLLAPPGALFVAWATAALELQLAVPLAPVYACGVFGVLFMVPLSFARR